MSDHDAPESGTFPAIQLSIPNPAGGLLVLRAVDVEEMVSQLNDIWDGHVGKRTDLTNVMLFSFNPGIIADMREGRSPEEAFGLDRDMDELAVGAYKALAAGATRQPTQTGAAAGARSNGSSGGATIFTVDERDGNLPAWFLDQLTRNDLCPECKDPEGKFYDNSADPGKGPHFRCANRDCKTSKGYPWGAWPDKGEERSRSRSSRTR